MEDKGPMTFRLFCAHLSRGGKEGREGKKVGERSRLRGEEKNNLQDLGVKESSGVGSGESRHKK